MRWRGLGFFIISCFMCSVCSAVVQVEPSNPYPDSGGGTQVKNCIMTSAIGCDTHTFLQNCIRLETKKGPDGICYSSCQTCAAGYENRSMIATISYGASERCIFEYNSCSCTQDSCGPNETCVGGTCACKAGYEPAIGGSFTGETVTGCIPCGAGNYKRYSGNAKCQPCPAGTHTELRQLGSTSCLSCGKGSYNDKTGQDRCTRCPNGGTTDNEGAKSITDCYIPKDSLSVSFEDEYGSGTLTVTENCYAID